VSILGYGNLMALEAKVTSGNVGPKSSVHISGSYEYCLNA